MKIGTITFHAPNNNGSFFQAYALQRFVTECLDCDYKVIDFQSEQQLRQYSLFRSIRSISDIVKNLISLLHYYPLKKRNKRFENVRSKYLSMTERCSSKEQVGKLAETFDVVIAGSDQIWNTEAPDFSEAYLLPKVKAKKIAYAVSMGSLAENTHLLQYKEQLEEFAAIAVREKTVQKYIYEKMGIESEITLDPTLLLDKSKYREFTTKEPLIDEPYIFFYSISYPPEVMKVARQIADEKRMKIITVFTSFHTITCENHGIKVMYDAGPEEFVNLLMNAQMVLTNSFHGTAFSVIFNKPFLHICKTIGGKLQRDDRIDGLLEMLGIVDCSVGMCNPKSEVPNINWMLVNEKRAAMAESAGKYIKKVVLEK